MPAKKNLSIQITKFKTTLRRAISPPRYKHSLRTAKWARRIAELCGYDPDKAELTGLLHDCAKTYDAAHLLAQAKKQRIPLRGKYRENPLLLHSPLGAVVAREKYGITDRQILRAIKNHTLGCKNMGKLEKIIFVADYSEPGRNSPEAKAVRKLLRKTRNLDRAVAAKIRNNTRKYL